MKALLRYGYFPLLGLGGIGGICWLSARHVSAIWLWLLLASALLLSFAAERMLPYCAAWNRSTADGGRDLIHAMVNIALAQLGLWLYAKLNPAPLLWPQHWPFTLQFVAGLLVLDLGISATHHTSHRVALLWRFHAVHHSVLRLYGFNGLMKHPLHQLIETACGALPLLLLGAPPTLLSALAFAVELQLLLQHSNVDYRSGFLRYLCANAEAHRHHHRNQSQRGDVNFGLFTTLWDHLAGSFYAGRDTPRSSAELGIENRPQYPQGYLAQLREPFMRRPL